MHIFIRCYFRWVRFSNFLLFQQHGKRFFEVIWKSTWEEEEVVRSLADDLVEEFLKCSNGEDVSNGHPSTTEEDEQLSGDEDRLQISEVISYFHSETRVESLKFDIFPFSF